MKELNLTDNLSRGREISSRLKTEYGANIGACYQCGKCAAGCPLAEKMDYNSRQIINLLKNGLYDEALHSTGVWQCVGCGTCSARCPRGVDPDAVMEAMNIEAKAEGIIGDKPLNIFNDNFLKLVKRYGRVHEMELMIRYNLQTGKLLKDAFYAPQMFFKGKLAIFPHRIKARKEVAGIFQRAAQLRGEDK